jgi:hypothetical protein
MPHLLDAVTVSPRRSPESKQTRQECRLLPGSDVVTKCDHIVTIGSPCHRRLNLLQEVTGRLRHLASALRAGCETLYSEDLHTGQIIDGQLTVQNPFF